MANTNTMIVATDNGLYVVTPGGVSGRISFAGAPGVQFYPGVRPRFAVLNRYTVLVNCVSQPIWLDTDASPHYLSIVPPATAPTLAAGIGTGLTGAYKVLVQFLVKDANGNVLAQSQLGPQSSALTLANQNISATAVPLSTQAGVNARRIYRTATNGSVYFQELDIDDNITTAITLGAPDASLAIFAAPLSTVLGAAPSRLTNVTMWKNRLWGVSASDPDTLVATAANDVCSWPLTFPMGPRWDTQGIYGFLPRRDELAILKRSLIWKMTGDAPTNFKPLQLVDGIGGGAPDSCVVIQDVGYFLGGPKANVTGVYVWNNDGVRSITDDTVRAWFTTDTYFNRANFPNAVGGYDPLLQAYVLLLSSPGNTVLDRWVAYDLNEKHWMGPHQTAAFTPAGVFTGFDSGGHSILMLCGADGNVYRSDPTVHADGTNVGIAFDILGKFFSGNPPEPDRFHVWQRPSVYLKKQASGSLTLTPRVGQWDNAVIGTVQTADMTKNKNVLQRLGSGDLCQLEFSHSVAGEPVELYGFDLPYATKGRRS